MPVPSYPPTNAAENAALLEFIRSTPLTYGRWRDFKGLYKQIEAASDADPELLAAFAARLDRVPFTPITSSPAYLKTKQRRYILDFTVYQERLYILHSNSRTNASQGLSIYQLLEHDPLQPRLLGENDLTGAQHITFANSYLLATKGNESEGSVEVQIFDCTNPGKLEQLGKINAGSGSIETWGDFAFVPVRPDKNRPGNFTGLRVISLANPKEPVVAGELAMERTSGLTVSPEGRLAAVFCEGKGFTWSSLPKAGSVQLVDITIPTRPALLGKLDIKNTLSGVIEGNYLYLRTESPSTLVVCDISNPQQPRKLETWQLQSSYDTIQTFTVRQGYIYLLTRYNSLIVMDARNPRKLEKTAEFYTGSSNSLDPLLRQTGDYLYRSGGDYSTHRLECWNITNPGKPIKPGQPPSVATIAYMKRRVRRTLRNLGKKDPGRFVEAAFHTLKTTGSSGAPVDPARQWVTMDLLFGGGARYYQTRHGRGAYRPTDAGRKFWLHQREERLPEAWNQRPDLARTLLTTPDLSWQIHAFAARVLLANGQEFPEVTDRKTLTNWLSGDPSLLMVVATRGVADLLDRPDAIMPEPDLTARALFYANRVRRARLAGAIARRADLGPGWIEKVGLHLSKLIAERGVVGEQSLTRRALAAARIIAAIAPASFGQPQMLQVAGQLLRSSEPALTALVAASAEEAKPTDIVSWLELLTGLSDPQREPVLQALEQAVKPLRFSSAQAANLAFNPAQEMIHTMGWRLLAASSTDQAVLGALWHSLLEQTVVSNALRSAMASPYALSLLERSGISSEEFIRRIEAAPFLAGLLSADTFRGMLSTSPTATVLQITAALPENKWRAARDSWLRRLREGLGLAELWLALPEVLEQDSTGTIGARILEDPEFRQALLGLEADHAPELIGIRSVEMDSLLAAWIDRHLDSFSRDSAILREAAIHPLSEVRSWGLRRARAVGFGLPFALRLLECEIPASVELGQGFFAAVPPGSDRELDYALALCDSPLKSVRRYGRQFAESRLATLPAADLYRALFENPDPEVQAWVASLLRQEQPAAVAEEVTQFHREVLRQRNRGRRAKEAVKARQEEAPSLDTATLLEMARGASTPRDAEWALTQLARRAVAGETIPDLSVEGIAG